MVKEPRQQTHPFGAIVCLDCGGTHFVENCKKNNLVKKVAQTGPLQQPVF